MAPALAFETNPVPSVARSRREEKKHLDRLPSETLDAIFKHVGSDDLLSLSLACRSLHALAASRLYRRVSHICGCQDSMADRLSLDWFTAKLQTLAASEYDYASFVRQISLERVNLTDVTHGEYRGEFREENGDNEYTSGKYFSALLLIVLKRVTDLESFRWDIRVELNPWILEILSKISSLQSLHIRLPSSDIPLWSSYSASDHIVHFAHLRIRFVAMSYMAYGPVDNDVAHILYPSRLGLDICALERIVNADQMGTSGTQKSAVPLAFKGPASDLSLDELTSDENNVFGTVGRMNKVIKGLKLSDIAGIKMREKDTWNMRL